MRFLLLLLSSFLINVIYAQTGAEALFKAGTELEYKTTMGNPGGGKIKELTRLTLIVNHVKDSNNATYSYITKRARSVNMPEAGYEKNYIVYKTADKIYLPQDLYTADTVYLADAEGVKGKKGKRAYATAEFKQPSFIALTIDFTKGKMNFEPSTYSIEGKMLQYDVNAFSITHGYVVEKKWEIKTTVKKVSVGAKTTVTTDAGKFDCYKLTSNMEMELAGMNIPFESNVYYSEKYGIIKTEPVEKAAVSGFELVRVKEL